MSSKRNYLRLIPTFIVTTSLILSACQDSGHKKVKIAQTGADRSAEIMQKANLSAEDEKKYVKDPMSQTAYKTKLSSIFNKMDDQAVIPWSVLFKLKRWIIKPADIKKDITASVSVSTADYGHFARQTMYDIFIDEGIYKDRNENEKADIILNEFLTSLYSFKYFTADELCDLVKSQNKNAQCKLNNANEVPDKNEASDAITGSNEDGNGDSKKQSEQSEDTDGVLQTDSSSQSPEVTKEQNERRNDPPKKVTPAKPKTQLTPEDYLNIKKVKEQIQTSGAQMAHADMLTLLKENKFDARVFEIKVSKVKSSGKTDEQRQADHKAEIGVQDVQSLFEQAKNLNDNKLACAFIGKSKTDESEHAKFFVELDQHKSVECLFLSSRAKGTNPKNQKEVNILKTEIKIDDKTLFSESMYQPTKNLEIARYEDPDSEKVTYLIPLNSTAIEQRTAGMVFRNSYLIADKSDNEEGWHLTGILYVPGVITETKEIDGKLTCNSKLADLNEKDLASELVIMGASEENVNLIKAIGARFPVTAPCW